MPVSPAENHCRMAERELKGRRLKATLVGSSVGDKRYEGIKFKLISNGLPPETAVSDSVGEYQMVDFPGHELSRWSFVGSNGTVFAVRNDGLLVDNRGKLVDVIPGRPAERVHGNPGLSRRGERKQRSRTMFNFAPI